jgi:hypothetical protein
MHVAGILGLPGADAKEMFRDVSFLIWSEPKSFGRRTIAYAPSRRGGTREWSGGVPVSLSACHCKVADDSACSQEGFTFPLSQSDLPLGSTCWKEGGEVGLISFEPRDIEDKGWQEKNSKRVNIWSYTQLLRREFLNDLCPHPVND